MSVWGVFNAMVKSAHNFCDSVDICRYFSGGNLGYLGFWCIVKLILWCYVVQTGVVHSAHQLKTLSLCICIFICNCIRNCILNTFLKMESVMLCGSDRCGAHGRSPVEASAGLCCLCGGQDGLGPLCHQPRSTGVWRQTLITVPPNLGIRQLTPFLLWPGGSNWRNVRAGTTNKRKESKQEGGVKHQSHISFSETADHPSSSCEQKEKIDTSPKGQKSNFGRW